MIQFKRCPIWRIFLILFVVGSALPSAAQGGGGGLSFSVYPSPAPNGRGSGASKTAYNNWAGRALDSVENNKGNVGNAGNDPGAFFIIRNAKPRQYLVTSNPSWLGKASPTGAFANQQGNRVHFVMHVRGNGTVRFTYNDIKWEFWSTLRSDGNRWFDREKIMSETDTQDLNYVPDRVDCTYGYGYDWGADRVKGGTDDTKVCNTGDTTLVDELFYVGAGLGHWADRCYNNPVGRCADYVLPTVQAYLYDHCQYFNITHDWTIREIGMIFHIEGSDGNTYTHTEKLGNPEFGRALNPANCRLLPVVKTDGSGGGSGGRSGGPSITPTSAPSINRIAAIFLEGFDVSAEHGLHSGVQFQRLDSRAIGNQAVVDAGFIDAVDVWGYAEQEVEICFPSDVGAGPLLFLDATTSPRAVRELPSVMRDGSVCGTVNGPGTVVMVQSWPGASMPTEALPAPTAAPPLETTALQNCMATTTHILNFRDAPGGGVLLHLPYNVTLTAIERTADWFRVDYHGQQGWISADYVATSGSCE